MNRTDRIQIRNDRLLARWGGSYVLRMQALTQLISFVAATIGIGYILITAHFTKIQIQQLLVSVFGFVALVNILIPVFTGMATRNARMRLDIIFKNKTNTRKISDDDLELVAWNEIIALPGKYAIAELATAYILVVIPVVIFMMRIGQATTMQTIDVAIGGIVSATAVVIQNGLFLDRSLAAVRRALLPHDPALQSTKSSMSLQFRVLVIISALVISAIAMLGPLGYQKLLDVQTAGPSASIDIKEYVIQASIIAFFLLLAGTILSIQLSQSASQPIAEMVKTMNEVKKGNLSQRSRIITSDETAELTIQLNQLLHQLQSTQRDLEQKVEERTSDLSRKAVQLQTSAQIARDTAAQREISSLLARTVDLISDQFGFYHAGIFLMDESGDTAILQAASSEGGKRMLDRGHQLEIGQGIVGSAVRNNKPRVATDVGTDAEYFNNPDLPGTRSEAAIPLAVKGKIIGVIDIQSTEPAAFSQEDIQVLQTLADQIALAIQNARLISESQNALQRLEAATADDMRQTWRERIRDTKKAYRYTSIGLTPLSSTENRPASSEADANRLNIPITLRGQRIGNIALNRKGNTRWSEADRALAIEIANQVGLALENARLLEEAQRRAAQEQSLSELTGRLSRSLDVDILLQTALRELQQLPNVTEASVYMSPTVVASATSKQEASRE